MLGPFPPDSSAWQSAFAVQRIGFAIVPHWPGNPVAAAAPPAFDLLLIAPFRCSHKPATAIAEARALAAERPLIVMTGADCAGERALALAAGADDAISPGCDGAELAARVQALWRRMARPHGILTCDELEIDLLARSVAREGRPIAMPLREFDLLAYLARSRDRVVARDDLLRAVWRMNFHPGTNRIEVHISRLRQRVDAGASHPMLRTVKGVGYALVSRAGDAHFAPHHFPAAGAGGR